MASSMQNVQMQFCEWLKNNNPKFRPDVVCQLLGIGETFCKRLRVLNAPLFETTDVDIIKNYGYSSKIVGSHSTDSFPGW